MKITLLLVLLVVIWRWTCANSPPCCSETSETIPGHRCQHTEPINDFDDPQRAKRNVITSLADTVKNATKYIGRKLHIIRKRESGEPELPPPHDEHLSLGNRTEVGKVKRNVTIGNSNETHTTVSNTLSVGNKTNSDKQSEAVERIKREMPKRGINKTHKIHRRREDSISKNDFKADANCTRTRRDAAVANNATSTMELNKNSTNNQFLASNKTSRHAQKPTKASKSVPKASTRKPERKSKSARVARGASNLTITTEATVEKNKLKNTATNRNTTKIKRAISHSTNTTAKLNKNNERTTNVQTHARTARDIPKYQNETSKSNVNATKLKREDSQRNNETRIGNKRVSRDVANLNTTEALGAPNNTRTDKRIIRGASETNNAKNDTKTSGEKTLTRTTRKVSEANETGVQEFMGLKRDVPKSTNVTVTFETKETPKILNRVAREANESVHNATSTTRNVSESVIAKKNSKHTQNLTRTSRDVSNSQNITEHDLTKVKGSALNTTTTSKNLEDRSDTSQRVSRNVPEIAPKNTGNIQNLTRTSRSVPKSKNEAEQTNHTTHNITKVKREVFEPDNTTTKSEKSKNTKNIGRKIRDVSKSDNAKKKPDEDSKNVHDSTTATRSASKSKNDTGNDEKTLHNLARVARGAPQADKKEHHQNAHNITKSDAKNPTTTKLDTDDKTRVKRDDSETKNFHNATRAKRDKSHKTKPNSTSNKTDQISKRNVSEVNNATKIDTSNGTTVSMNDKGKTHIMRVPRTSNNATKSLNKNNTDTTKVKRDISKLEVSKHVQNATRVRRDSIDTTKHSHNDTSQTSNSNTKRTERDVSKSINETVKNKAKNGTEISKRVSRDVPKLKLSYENTRSAYNTTRTEEDSSFKLNKSKKVANKTKDKRRIPRESNKSENGAMNVTERAAEILKNDTESNMKDQDNNFELRSSKNVAANESKENNEDNNSDDSTETIRDSLVDAKNNNEADNNRLRRNQRKSTNTTIKHHYDHNDTRLPRFAKTSKNNSASNERKERVEIDSALKIAVPIDGRPIEAKAELSKTKRSDDNDGTDVEYILIHDVPPCRRRKRSEEYDQSDQFESKLTGTGNRKNITIIIQNLVATMRKKREASDSLNITTMEQPKNDNDTVRRGNVELTKANQHHHRSKRDAKAYKSEKDMKCCPPQSVEDNEILISQRDKIWKPITRNSEIPPLIGVPSSNNNSIQAAKNDSVAGIRSKKSGRSLLSVAEGGNSENDIDMADSQGTKESFMGFSGSTRASLKILHNNMVDDFEPHFFVNGEEHGIRTPVEKTSIKPVDKVKCACAIFFDDPESKEKSPFVIENFLDYPKGATPGDREIICSRTCSESSKLYYKMKQVVLCTHVKNFHHHLQTIMPIEHTPEEDDESETIFCQVVPGEAEPPLRYIVSWLNIILLDVVVCLTGLGIVCVYLICFVTWKKRDAIPIYTSASFTVK